MLDRVIIIDNIREEIDELVNSLRSYDIAVDTPEYSDDYEQFPVYHRNHQLIFMDLMLDEDVGHLKTNISRVIGILSHIVGEGFGPYGLVLWTKHLDTKNEVLKRLDSVSNNKLENQEEVDAEEINIDVRLQNPPVFVIGVDKLQFKKSGEWDFSDLMPVINQIIQESNASYFFLRWLSVTRQAAQDTISSIYGLTHSYAKIEGEISHILIKLALNQTGIDHYYSGLTADAYKAFSDVIHPKINALTGSETLPILVEDKPVYTPEEEIHVLARLNSFLFIDDIGIAQDEVVPGNVYEVMDGKSPVIVSEDKRINLQKKKKNSDELVGYKDYDCTPIAIELTPPCDYSQNNRVLSRVIGGYIINMSANENPKKRLQGSEKRYILPPVYIPGDDNLKYVVLDFLHLYSPTEMQLKDSKQYRVLFRVNRSLFSDILQKFSSHAARLGLNGLEPWK